MTRSLSYDGYPRTGPTVGRKPSSAMRGSREARLLTVDPHYADKVCTVMGIANLSRISS